MTMDEYLTYTGEDIKIMDVKPKILIFYIICDIRNI